MAGRRLHAFGDDALGEHDATALATLIESGQLSAAEVFEATVARADRVRELNAIVVDDVERGRQRALAPRPGVFSGVPTIVKDNTDVAGLPTNHGSEAFTGRVATADAPFTTMLAGLGLINFGKSRLPEFGLNAATEFMTQPPTRNPWHLDHSPGASSGGAAALVASGVLPIAHANDGGGSIRIPAACCGLVGLKPTRGRFAPGHTERLLPVDVISEGVLTRSVRDTARAFAGLERQYRAPDLPPIGVVEGPSQRRLRVGLVLDSINGVKTEDQTRTAVSDTAELLATAGHHVEEVELPLGPRFADDFGIYWGLLATALRGFGNRIYDVELDRSKLDGLTRGLSRHFTRHALQMPAAIARLRRSRVHYARMFTKVDVVVSPVLAHPAPPIGYLSPTVPFADLFKRLNEYAIFTPLHNAAGSPGLSLPLGSTADGIPIGVHLSAGHGDERTLLELAFEIEAARPWRRITAP